MGFDVENTSRGQIIGQQIRNDNYFESAENHSTQRDMILKALPRLYVTINNQINMGVSSASRIYNYLIEINLITLKTPLTSIRRALTNMAHPKDGEKQYLIEYGEIKSKLYNSTETLYKVKIFQTGLF